MGGKKSSSKKEDQQLVNNTEAASNSETGERPEAEAEAKAQAYKPETTESGGGKAEGRGKSEAAEKPAVIVPEDEPINEKEEINKLLDEGYSVKQIIDLGFKRRTVYHYAKQRMNPENAAVVGSGQANGTGGKTRQEMLKLGSKDVIPPEAVLEVIHLPRNGDAVEVWRRGVLDGVGMLLLGARYAQLTAAGQAEIVKSQLDIMQEAKESGRDIAQEAAKQTAIHVVNYLDERLPKAEDTTKEKAGGLSIPERMFGPIAEMFGKQMANMFARALGPIVGGQPVQNEQFQVPQGWQYKTEGGK